MLRSTPLRSICFFGAGMANVESQINVRRLVVEDQKLLLQSLQRGLIAEGFLCRGGVALLGS